jgi:hypothetical protein
MNFKFLLEWNNATLEVDEPVGFDDMVLYLKRDMKNFGINFEYSSELSFYTFGRDFIVNAYNTHNIDAVVKLKVYYLNPQTNVWTDFYEGVLGLKDLKISNVFAKCRVERSDFVRTFNNKKDIDVSLTTSKLLRLHSRMIRYETKLEVMDDFTFVDFTVNGVIFREGYSSLHYLLFPKLQNELQYNNDISGVILDVNYINSTPTPLFTFRERGQVSVTGRIKGRLICVSNNISFGTQIVAVSHQKKYITNSNLVLYNSGFVSVNQGNIVAINFDFTINQNFFAEAGESYWNFFRLIRRNLNSGDGGGSIGYTLDMDDSSYLNVYQDTVADSSACKSLTIFEAFRQMVREYTGVDCFVSDYFSGVGCGRYLDITNGFWLRNKIEKDFFLDFDTLYKGLKSIFNLGLDFGVLNGLPFVRVEPMEYFFEQTNNNNPVEINGIQDYELSPALDLYFNKILVGYKKWSDSLSGSLNGLQEYNSERQYLIDIRLGEFQDIEKNRKQLDIVSNLITSGTLIETVRRLGIDGKNSIDSNYDNDCFLICTNEIVVQSNLYGQGTQTYQQGTVSQRDEMFTFFQNLLSPATAYNLRLSPARNLERHLSFIQSQLQLNFATLNRLFFVSGTGNFLLRGQVNALYNNCYYHNPNNTLNENQNLVGFENKAIFEAKYLDFEFPIGFDLFLRLVNEKNKYILVQGQAFYLVDLKYSLRKGMGTFKMLKAISRVYSWGNGLKFNGVNNFIRTSLIPSISSNGFKSGEFTVNVFVRFKNVSDSFVFHNYFNLSGSTRIDLYMDRATFYPLVFELTRAFTFPTPLLLDVVYSFTFVKNFGLGIDDFDVYMNGVICQKSVIFSNNATDSPYNASVSEINAIAGVNQFYKNDIHDLKIFNKALDNSEIVEIFEKKGEVIPVTAQSNCVLDLRFEEKTGFTASDSSGNGNNATLQNYTLSQVSLGVNNHHIDEEGNPILN